MNELREGATLDEAFVRQRRPLAENLEVAIALAAVLEGLHRRRLIHRSLGSDRIVISSSSPLAVTLLGGEGAARANGTGLFSESAHPSSRSLAYLSPEQTGRVNRLVDRRADLYALGVVLYEVFTGRLPFTTENAAELIHCHLARQPVPPIAAQPDVPATLSNLIQRLLAKNPDERYQSAFGVQADLDQCLQQWRQNGRIEAFELGQADYRGLLQLPQSLHGRPHELQSLKDAVKDAGRGNGRVVLVSGPAGVGKTALLEELQPYVTSLGGLFLKGTHYGSQRHVPYAGLVGALGVLVDRLLTESAGQLDQWKARLLEAAGSNGRLLIEMLPRLELILGPQPVPPEVGPAEAQHRFLHLFNRFVRALGRRERPLVLWLDNLQWADHASLRLLDLLLPEIDTQPIVFLGTYREEELSAEHPLGTLIETLKPLKTMVRTIALEGLSLDSMSRLVAEALQVESAFAPPLAQLVQEKTGGNPLFAVQLLQSLEEEGLLRFDPEMRRWQWNADGIRKREIAGNLARLMTQKIESLPGECQSLLSLAACAGNRFTLESLAATAEMPAAQAADQLQAAVAAGLLRVHTPPPLSGHRPGSAARAEPEMCFEFPHDRVRQAAYALLPRKQRRLAHFRLGQRLLQQTPAGALEEQVFEIADQLNEGFQHLTEDRQRRQLVELNLAAGRKAKRTAAHQAAIRYLSMGIGLLPEDRWEHGRELTLRLFLEAAEAEYLSTNFERAALLSAEVLAHAQDLLTRLRVHELRILFFTAQNQNAAAIRAGLDALDELDMPMPADPDQAGAAAAAWERELAEAVGRVEDLAQSPPMTDARCLAAMRVLMHLTAPAHRASHSFLQAVIARMVLLAVRHGNSPWAAVAYGWHGALLCGNAGSIEAGYRYGRLSLDVLGRFPAPELEAKVWFLFNAQVRHWKENAHDCIAPLQEVHRRGIETGDLEDICSGAIHHCGYLFCTGAPLDLIERKHAEHFETMAQSRLPFHSQLARIWGQTIANLRADPVDPCRLAGEWLDEARMLPAWIQEHNSPLVLTTLCNRAMLQCLFGDYAGAAASSRQAEAHAQTMQGFIYLANHCFYHALALLAGPETADAAEPLVGRLRQWAALAPANFAHRLALVEAELARRAGEMGPALESFSRAIRLARENGYLHDEALAYEREASFHRALGRDDLATFALREALGRYRTWGALRKVQEMEHRHKGLTGAAPTPLDFAVVVRASHMLSQEIRLEQLLERLLSLVIEHAGAQTGILIQNTATGLLIQARAEVGRSRVETMQATPVAGSGEVALTVVNYVARTQSQVVLGDACRDRTFGADKYVAAHRTRSLLCLPMVYQGKLLGLLYLENNLAADVFTAGRLEMLTALASQAAISMENAGLYADLESKVSALQQAEGELRQYRDVLEEQVAARTSELTEANARLVQEIADRVNVQAALQTKSDELQRSQEALLHNLEDLREKTAELKAANQKLEVVNKELEAFSYSVSHDLRAPLRSLDGFSQALLEDYAETMDAQAKHYLERIRAAAQRMGLLVDDLLSLSRIARGELQIGPVNLSSLAREIANELARHEPDRRVHFRIADDVKASGDPRFLRVALENLLGNAWKFTSKRAVADIEFGVTRQESEPAYFVRDNGAGFDMQYAQRLFGAFQRLHSSEEFPGTGVGLATVQRVIHRHGGRIWAEGCENQGAVFYFTLKRE